MTDPKLHELLDQTKFGDQLTLAHSAEAREQITHEIEEVAELIERLCYDPRNQADWLRDRAEHIGRGK